MVRRLRLPVVKSLALPAAASSQKQQTHTKKYKCGEAADDAGVGAEHQSPSDRQYDHLTDRRKNGDAVD